MATKKDVTKTKGGRLKYSYAPNETFSDYNKPKRTPNANKQFAVLAKKGDQVKLVRFGDQSMEIKADQKQARKNFRARHSCDEADDKFSARYWSCKKWEK